MGNRHSSFNNDADQSSSLSEQPSSSSEWWLLFHTLAFWCAVLGIKCAATAQSIGYFRVRTIRFRCQEDMMLNPSRNERIMHEQQQNHHQQSLTEWPDRLQSIQRNDIENIPIFLLVATIYTIALSSTLLSGVIYYDNNAELCMEACRTIHVYGIARLFHTLFYVLKIQPHRTMAFGIALASQYYLCALLLRWTWITSRNASTTIETCNGNWFCRYFPIMVLLPLLGQFAYYTWETPRVLLFTFLPVRATASSSGNAAAAKND